MTGLENVGKLQQSMTVDLKKLDRLSGEGSLGGRVVTHIKEAINTVIDYIKSGKWTNPTDRGLKQMHKNLTTLRFELVKLKEENLKGDLRQRSQNDYMLDNLVLDKVRQMKTIVENFSKGTSDKSKYDPLLKDLTYVEAQCNANLKQHTGDMDARLARAEKNRAQAEISIDPKKDHHKPTGEINRLKAALESQERKRAEKPEEQQSDKPVKQETASSAVQQPPKTTTKHTETRGRGGITKEVKGHSKPPKEEQVVNKPQKEVKETEKEKRSRAFKEAQESAVREESWVENRLEGVKGPAPKKEEDFGPFRSAKDMKKEDLKPLKDFPSVEEKPKTAFIRDQVVLTPGYLAAKQRRDNKLRQKQREHSVVPPRAEEPQKESMVKAVDHSKDNAKQIGTKADEIKKAIKSLDDQLEETGIDFKSLKKFNAMKKPVTEKDLATYEEQVGKVLEDVNDFYGADMPPNIQRDLEAISKAIGG